MGLILRFKGYSLLSALIIFVLIIELLYISQKSSFSGFIGCLDCPRNAALDARSHVNSNQSPLQSGMVPEEGNHTAGAKLGMVTMLYGDSNPTYERALDTHRRHARQHGYPLFVNRQKMLGRLWTKPAYILGLVLSEMAKPAEHRLEWLFWFDADTVLVNSLIPLETYLPTDPELGNIHFLCGNDHHGLNDGAFLLRVNDFAVHMLSASLSVETYRPEVDLKYSEQSAIEHVVTSRDTFRPWDGTTYSSCFANIPQRWLNGYIGGRSEDGLSHKDNKKQKNEIQEGDILLHFVGSGDTKQDRMAKFLDAWDIGRENWEIPLSSTRLEQEISDYWKSFKLKRSKTAKADDEIAKKSSKPEVPDKASKVGKAKASTKSGKADDEAEEPKKGTSAEKTSKSSQPGKADDESEGDEGSEQ